MRGMHSIGVFEAVDTPASRHRSLQPVQGMRTCTKSEHSSCRRSFASRRFSGRLTTDT